jgi:hypothetical protein
LTAHFFDLWVLAPHGKLMPEARGRLTDLAVRLCAQVP